MADTPKLDRPRAPGPLAQLPGLLLAALVPMDALAGDPPAASREPAGRKPEHDDRPPRRG